MKVEFRRSFTRDLRKLRNRQLSKRIREVIEQLEDIDSLQEISGVKNLRGSENYYRIRIGDYRIGLLLEDDIVTLVRFLHRKDIYRYFP